MINPAGLGDMQAVLMRPLTDAEADASMFWLPIAWAGLQEASPGIVDRIAAGERSEATVRGVIAAAVARVLRNPEGLRQRSRTIDDYTEAFTMDSAVSTGELYFTSEELAKVGPLRRKGAAFSISTANLDSTPTVLPPFYVRLS